MIHWKAPYLFAILIYVLGLAGMVSLALLGIFEVPGEQGVSLFIAGLALLISLIQMAETHKKRIPVSVHVKIWGYLRGSYLYATMKYHNQLSTPLDDFRFKLKLPKGLVILNRKSESALNIRSYGKTDVITCEDMDFLGARNSGADVEFISLRFDTSKLPKQKRVATLTLSATGLAPVRLKLSTDQLIALLIGEYRSEALGVEFAIDRH